MTARLFGTEEYAEKRYVYVIYLVFYSIWNLNIRLQAQISK